jgi:thiol-disulfide isomerase/thioredoxin
LALWALAIGLATCARRDDAGSKANATAATSVELPATEGSAYVTIELPRGLTLIDGPTLLSRVRETKARGVVINVWASWCGPCKAEMPMMLKLQQEFGNQNLEFVFVSVDSLDKLRPVIELLQEYQIALPGYVAMPPLADFKAALSPRWQGSLPSTFLFDPTGKLRYWWGAQVFEEEIRPILKGFLAGEHIDGEANFKIRRGAGQL